MENCERRIKAEKLAAETQIERTESNAKVNEEHALKVQQMQLVRPFDNCFNTVRTLS